MNQIKSIIEFVFSHRENMQTKKPEGLAPQSTSLLGPHLVFTKQDFAMKDITFFHRNAVSRQYKLFVRDHRGLHGRLMKIIV